MLAIEINEAPHGSIARATPDGSWWIDWDTVTQLAAGQPNTQSATVVFCRLLVAARGNLPEVTRQRSDELAKEWGAKVPQWPDDGTGQVA